MKYLIFFVEVVVERHVWFVRLYKLFSRLVGCAAEQKVKVPPLHCDSRVKTVCADVMKLPREKVRALSPKVYHLLELWIVESMLIYTLFSFVTSKCSVICLFIIIFSWITLIYVSVWAESGVKVIFLHDCLFVWEEFAGFYGLWKMSWLFLWFLHDSKLIVSEISSKTPN